MGTKEILRKERGITLVALIITIIVLIILAAVSINAVLKTDFIGLATEGTINYANAQSYEQREMEDLSKKLDEVINKISGEQKRKADYVDIDGDGIADGVIYADLTKGKTGVWDGLDIEQYAKKMVEIGYSEDGARREAENRKEYAKQNYTYTIPTVTSGLKEYEVVKTDYVGDFGTGKLIKQKEGTTGLDRYYIMALKEVDLPYGMEVSGESYKIAYWYYNAYKMLDYSTFTSKAFGEGKNNTKKMVARWRANGTAEGSTANYGEGRQEDIWGQIGAPTNVDDIVWFVPSYGEWCAFAGELGINGANFNDFKLANHCWTSSAHLLDSAWCTSFDYEHISSCYIRTNFAVRLSATF